jgi:hypothetical protein
VHIEDLSECRLDKLFLAVEVVLERSDPHVGGLGYFQHRHIELAGGDESLHGLPSRLS